MNESLYILITKILQRFGAEVKRICPTRAYPYQLRNRQLSRTLHWSLGNCPIEGPITGLDSKLGKMPTIRLRNEMPPSNGLLA